MTVCVTHKTYDTNVKKFNLNQKYYDNLSF